MKFATQQSLDEERISFFIDNKLVISRGWDEIGYDGMRSMLQLFIATAKAHGEEVGIIDQRALHCTAIMVYNSSTPTT